MPKGKKFDILISNPPFDGKSNIHLQFMEKYKEISNISIVISPDQWLKISNINRPFGKYRNIFNGYIKDIEHISHRESNDIFNLSNGIESLAIYILEKNNSFNLKSYGFKNKHYESLFNKIIISKNNKQILTFNACKYNDEYGYLKYINHPMVRQDFDVPVYTWHGGENCYNAVIMSEEREKTSKGVSFTLRFKSAEEVKHFKDSLNTKFMNWYYWNFIFTGYFKLMNYMFRLKDYSKPVTDETFYKLFDLNEDEIKIIENFNSNDNE